MLFYSCDIRFSKGMERGELISKVRLFDERAYSICPYRADADLLSVCAITRIPLQNVLVVIKAALRQWEISSDYSLTLSEINLSQLADRLLMAEKQSFIQDANSILRRYDLLTL